MRHDSRPRARRPRSYDGCCRRRRGADGSSAALEAAALPSRGSARRVRRRERQRRTRLGSGRHEQFRQGCPALGATCSSPPGTWATSCATIRAARPTGDGSSSAGVTESRSITRPRDQVAIGAMASSRETARRFSSSGWLSARCRWRSSCRPLEGSRGSSPGAPSRSGAGDDRARLDVGRPRDRRGHARLRRAGR